eukprot:CAMPEP_0114589998 /NCGR_PEP_ID=MMETSP0125-20121206/12325_1 /TAXON_ID=485358 ORGANISM="Aristerostoma sp., Strain ATCC 50986" /NCGR_SAMPLE_ID=MMETSP0125 /ASSEMBLY_ACC=CAM_ASM_000245 /LENGTH=181 /DNA_ID=CAMNT_0001787203 /DNA_START=849 /DNA_END=1394 /DNA_ORIENTATION=-
MGVWIDPLTEYVYSVSEDTKFKVHDANKNFTVGELFVGSAKHTGLQVDKENKRAFISNRDGQVFIYDINQKKPVLSHSIQAHSKGSAIRGLYYDPQRSYLFTVNHSDGAIGIFEIGKPGKEKFTSHTANFTGRKGSRVGVWSTNRYEFYSGDEDGTVTFFDAKKIAPIYAMKAHSGGICKL